MREKTIQFLLLKGVEWIMIEVSAVNREEASKLVRKEYGKDAIFVYRGTA